MELANLTWTDVDALNRDTPVIIPIAALEQYGHHLPVFTDSILMREIVRRAHESLTEQTLLVPLMWVGNSHHHMDFPGTVSAQPRVWIDLLGGIVDNFITHGFRRIVVINGHGGNDVPGRQAPFEIRQRYRDRRDLLSGQRAWIMPDRSGPGHVGAPGVATPEKGEQLLQLFADGVL